MKKKLYKSSTDQKISGGCAGVANYFGWDPTIIRVIYALLAVFTSGFPFVVLYIILAFVMDEDDCYVDTDANDITKD